MSNAAIDGRKFKEMILQAASTLELHKDIINALNVFPVPDGDTGTNMSMTMSSARKEVERSKDRTVAEVAAAVAQGSLMGARGNSGVILSQLFRGFSRGCDGLATMDGKALAKAFQEGVDTAYKAVMKPVEGTILTVARESAAAAVVAARRQSDPVKIMKVVLEAAEASLTRTPELLPVLKKAGVVDSGGKGLCLIYSSYYNVLVQGDGKAESEVAVHEGSPVPTAPVEADRHDRSPATRIDFKVDADLGDIPFPYDTELFIRRTAGGKSIPLDEVAKQLDAMGDSVYVVGGEDLAKVHIHTDNPGPVLSLCIQYGTLIDIVIHNMIEQHEDLLEHAERTSETQVAPAEENLAATGVVAVAVGDGVEDIFRSLGVAQIIQGGQTMNPSTQDLLEAIEACVATEVFVLPNNKNIILAAEQAAALTTKRVYVIPTRSIPQGIAAMVSWMPEEEDADRLHKAMLRSMEGVQTGEITFSVRDTVFGDIAIKEGDILGLWNGQIRLTGSVPDDVLVSLLDLMISEHGGDIITVYWGEGVDQEMAASLGRQIGERFPDHEIEVRPGGQPLYYYVFSLE